MPQLPAFLAGPFERWFGRSCVVMRVEVLAPQFRRIHFAGHALKDRPWKPGQDVEFRVASRDFRHYTPSWFDSARGEMDIVFYLHNEPALSEHSGKDKVGSDDGGKPSPGLEWIESLRAGVSVSVFGPAGEYGAAEGETWSMFLGDESAVSLFAALIAPRLETTSAGGKRAHIFGAVEVERADATETLATLVPALELLPREGTARGERLAAWVRGTDLPAGQGTAYVVGHARSVQQLRSILLSERNLDRRHIKARAFWADGKRGL